MNHRRAVRALALTLMAVIPLVELRFGDLGQRFGLRNGVFCVLARLACEAVRMALWCFRKLQSVSAAQTANIVLVAHRVAVLLAFSFALGAARHLVPSSIDTLGIKPWLWRVKPHLWRAIGVRPAMSGFVPDVCFS